MNLIRLPSLRIPMEWGIGVITQGAYTVVK